MRTEIIKLHKKLATTFIYVTHDQTEAMTMGGSVSLLLKARHHPAGGYPPEPVRYALQYVRGRLYRQPPDELPWTAPLIKKGDQYGIDLGGDIIPLPKEKTADGKLDAYVGKKMEMGTSVLRTSMMSRSLWQSTPTASWMHRWMCPR